MRSLSTTRVMSLLTYSKGEEDHDTITNENTVWRETSVPRYQREQLNQHRSVIIWLTGLSGSGKSTLANALSKALHERSARTYVLDGDNIRHGLCSDLGFSSEDRSENIRRIDEVSKLMMDAGLIVITAFISPFAIDRKMVRDMVEHGDYIAIHCDTPLHVCEKRDVKGLYRKAREGDIPDFTGISSPYEYPSDAELCIQTHQESIEDSVNRIIEYLISRDIIRDRANCLRLAS